MKSFKFLACLILAALLVLTGVVPAVAYTREDRSKVYMMYINDQEIGAVKFAARGLAIYDKVENRLRGDRQEEIVIDAKVYFKEIKANSSSITKDMALEKAIENAIDVKVNALAIIVEGEKICHVETLEDAEKALEEIKAPYIKEAEKEENSQLEDVALKQDIQFEEELVPEKRVISPKEALEKLTQGKEAVKEYEAEDGDTFWSIAQENDINVDELMAANPDVDEMLVKPGIIIKIGREEKLINVITKEKLTYAEELPFETETKEDNTLEKGKTKVIQEGEKGEKEITALVTMEDGQEIDREILKEDITKEPVPKIEAKGTKEPPRPVVNRSRNTSRNSSSSSSSSSKSSSTGRGTVSGGSGTGAQVANNALKHVGKAYTRNGSGPNSFDCSGFTQYVYRQFGVSLPHSSVSQRSVGRKVSKSELKPGDLVCFSNSNHVGIYIGGGKMVHASRPGVGVVTSSINGGRYPGRYVTARRIFD